MLKKHLGKTVLLIISLTTNTLFYSSCSFSTELSSDQRILDSSSEIFNPKHPEPSRIKKYAVSTSLGVTAILIELLLYFYAVRTKKHKDAIIPTVLNALPDKLFPHKTRDPQNADEVNFVENADSFVDSDCIKPSEDSYQNRFYITISSNYQNPDFDVKALCLAMGISKTKCYTDVFAMFKKTPKDLINDYRLTQGLRLLKGSNLQIGEIGSEIGFKSHSGFTKGFKKKFGYAPSQIVPFYHN